jgi:F-type H+-transporting ATPase subunit delta
MSDKRGQAQRYAQAAFEAMLERWQAALTAIADLLSKDKTLYAMLTDGAKPFAERAKALKAALPKDTPPEIANLLQLLVQEGDLALLPEMPDALALITSGQQQPVKAEVTSAVELSEADKEALQAALRKQFGEDLRFSFFVDSSLMGGLRVRVGDRLIDTSVASRLAALRESLASVVR